MVMNLRRLANSVTRVVNPNVMAVLNRNTGATTAASGSRTPQYVAIPADLQVQALTYSDLQKLDNLNIQGVRRAIYSNDQVFAIVRVGAKGGDIIVFQPGTIPEGDVWLCAHVLERWSPWCKIAITLQNDPIGSGSPSLDYSDPDNSQYFPGLQ